MAIVVIAGKKITILQLQNADSLGKAIQVDGSVEKYGIHNKFVIARFLIKEPKMTPVFLRECKSSKREAENLMDFVKI